MKIIGLFLFLSFPIMASKSSNLLIRGRVPASVSMIEAQVKDNKSIKINVSSSKYDLKVKKTNKYQFVTISFR